MLYRFMYVDGYTDTDCSNTENNNIIPIFNIHFFFNFIFIFVLSLSYRKWVVGSDGPMIDYNRKSVGLAFRLR